MEDQNEHVDFDHGEIIPSMNVETVPKKKKKKSKPKSKRGLAAPTGFEEYYVDTPITPDEYMIEREVYDPSRNFSTRIQTAIQRYKDKRNLNSERKDLFDKWMVYGGVDAGPKMFSGGLDSRTLEESDAADIAALTATDFVSGDKDDTKASGHVVDFDGCVKGFISSRLPQTFDLSTQLQIKSHIAVIRNFLNYLLHHDVCLEYDSQIKAARNTCDLAERQLWCIAQCASAMPGQFNMACSTLFGGYYENLYVGDQEWAKDLNLNAGMSPDQARKIFKFGLAAHGDDEVIKRYNTQVAEKTVHVEETFEAALEVTALVSADEEILSMYANFPGLSPLGLLRTKTWYPPLPATEDLTLEEEASLPPPVFKEHVLWVEDSLLEKCFVGMKFEATIRKLSFGVEYFDTVTGLFCTFYDVIPNELMLGWREHVYLEPRKKKGGHQFQEMGYPGDEDDEGDAGTAENRGKEDGINEDDGSGNGVDQGEVVKNGHGGNKADSGYDE